MARTLFIYIWTTFVTMIFGTSATLAAFFSRTGNFPHLIARVWARSILFASRIKVTVNGTSNIDPDRSYIFMPNHMGDFDIPVILGWLPVQFRWLAKAEIFKIPIMGRAMKGCGYISIDRTNRKKAFKSLNAAGQTIKNGASVLIFPEGTRSPDEKIKPFKKGGFVLAVEHDIPIIPVIIHGTWSIRPKGRFIIKPQNVLMEIKPAVETYDYTRKKKDELLEKLRNIICDSFYEKLQE